MAAVRFTLCLAVAVLLCCTPAAQAARLLVLHPDGKTTHRGDPGVAAVDPAHSKAHLQERGRTHAFLAKAPKKTVTRELRRLLDTGQIDAATYVARKDAYTSFKRAVKRFSGRRRADMAGVLGVVDRIAARGQLTPSRLEPLWL